MTLVSVSLADKMLPTKDNMGIYRIVKAEPVAGGVEVQVSGPGIPEAGVIYWFDGEGEARYFIENLNVSYIEAKRFAKWRRGSLQRGSALSAGTPARTAVGTGH